MNSRSIHLLRAVAIGTCAAGWIAACATSPVPDEKIAVAKAAVQHAEQSGAQQAASVPLANARDKLAQAQRAAAQSNGILAGRLADQANADAQLAEATAAQQRSHQSAVEFDASMQALRDESSRPTQSSE